MNQGSYDRNCEHLLIHIHGLNTYGKMKTCKATTKYLAKTINKSVRQTYKYLKTLEERDLIRRETSKLKRDKTTKKRYKLRNIKIDQAQKPRNSDEILSIFCDKTLATKSKNFKIKQIIKSNGFEYLNMMKTMDRVREKEDFNNYLDVLFPIGTQKMSLEQKELEAIREDEKKQKEMQFYAEREAAAKKIFNETFDWTVESALEKETYYEKLRTYSIEKHKTVNKMMEELEPPSYEEKVSQMQILAGNTRIEGKKFIVTFFMGSRISAQVELFEYVHWDKNSDYFKIFKGLMGVS